MAWLEGFDFKTKKGPVQYPAGKLYPYFHKEKMNWASAFVTEGDVDICFMSGETGRDPMKDRPARDANDELTPEGGVVVSMNIEDQAKQCLKSIKAGLEEAGFKLEHIVMWRYYLVHPHMVWGFRKAFRDFCMEHCPDLIKNPRNGTLLRGVGLDLPGKMLVEIEAWAVRPRKKA